MRGITLLVAIMVAAALSGCARSVHVGSGYSYGVGYGTAHYCPSTYHSSTYTTYGTKRTTTIHRHTVVYPRSHVSYGHYSYRPGRPHYRSSHRPPIRRGPHFRY